MERETWWKEQYKLCKNGKWIGGVWMPGNLYFYLNFWHIMMNPTPNSRKKLGRPFLRDIEWRIAYAWVEAQGFSGFDEDPDFTCNRLYNPQLKDKDGNNISKPHPKGLKFIPVQEYLSKTFLKSRGNPLWENNKLNLMMMGSRGFGKSYFVSGAVIAYEFLFFSDNQVVVGAGDSKYSSDLLLKVKTGLNSLPGGIEFNNEYYPSPFSKKYSGSWNPSKTITHLYDAKVGKSGWVTKGSRSSVKHISFKDNHTAANGTRPSVLILEEIGMFSNLMESHLSSVETMMNGGVKFGSGFYIGTGGDMGSGTVDARKMFYDPDPYDILPFDDEWENTGKIGFFMPAYLGLNDFKKDGGSTNIEAAVKYLQAVREKKRKSKDKNALNMELQYRPLVPSEAFLTNTGNVFNIDELKNQLNYLEINKGAGLLGQIGKLVRDENGVPQWKQAPENTLCDDWPIKANNDNTGSIVVYEHPPKDGIPFALYIGGIDPYDHDKAGTGSVGSCYIYKRFNSIGETSDIIVAEYVGRPPTANEFYENIRMLLEYYSATALYENERKGLHQYFVQKHCTHLLAEQPEMIKDIIKSSKVDRGKGIHMTNSIKEYAELLLRDMLSEEYQPGKTNYKKIYSRGLLQELMSYNDDHNFDRVIGFMMIALYNLELHKIHVKKKTEQRPRRDEFFEKQIYVHRATL
jgi:hypothetical protein